MEVERRKDDRGRVCFICPVCDDQDMSITWTDHHGVGACLRCNAPFQVYFYERDEDGKATKRIDKPTESITREDWLPLLQEYWKEHHLKIPNGLNFPGSNYEQCSEDDFILWGHFIAKLKEEGRYPKGLTEEEPCET